ncbi:MAG: cupin [Cyclobacteriaceae bacterium]|nr:MAG: cupin [Cyclobacteriaceae bacterium]
MKHVDTTNLESREIMKGFHGRMIHSDNMTFAHWEINAGASLPEHSHMHEQVVNVISGEFELTVDGVTKRLKPKDVVCIPSNAIHQGKAITDCFIIDVFFPIREDYRDKAKY